MIASLITSFYSSWQTAPPRCLPEESPKESERRVNVKQIIALTSVRDNSDNSESDNSELLSKNVHLLPDHIKHGSVQRPPAHPPPDKILIKLSPMVIHHGAPNQHWAWTLF